MTVSFQNISKSISLMPLAFFHRKIAIFYVFQLAVEIGACMRSRKALWIRQTSSLVYTELKSSIKIGCANLKQYYNLEKANPFLYRNQKNCSRLLDSASWTRRPNRSLSRRSPRWVWWWGTPCSIDFAVHTERALSV